MKENEKKKAEFLKKEAEFKEFKDLYPSELQNLLEQSLDLMRPHFMYKLPLREELQPVVEKLIYKWLPDLRIDERGWLCDWVQEIAADNISSFASSITDVFNLSEQKSKPNNFESMYEFYAMPRKAVILGMDDMSDLDLTEEAMKKLQAGLDEDNRLEEIACEKYNSRKREFIDAIQPILMKYFGDKMNEMDGEMWKDYAIELGFAFHLLNDDCLELQAVLKRNDLSQNPGMGFSEYNKLLIQEIERASQKESE